MEILTAKQIKRKFPWLRTDDIALGCYGYESEGWFDPWALLTGMYLYLKKSNNFICQLSSDGSGALYHPKNGFKAS